MFLLGLRGRDGRVVAVWLVLAWVVSLLLLLQSRTVISTVIVLFSVGVTAYGMLVLLRARESLRFNGRFAEEHAFPSTRGNERLILGFHALLLLLLYLPGTAMLVLKPPDLAEPETRMLTGIAFLVGNLGVAGLAMQGLRKLNARR
jgi:hypothetical protein